MGLGSLGLRCLRCVGLRSLAVVAWASWALRSVHGCKVGPGVCASVFYWEDVVYRVCSWLAAVVADVAVTVEYLLA